MATAPRSSPVRSTETITQLHVNVDGPAVSSTQQTSAESSQEFMGLVKNLCAHYSRIQLRNAEMEAKVNELWAYIGSLHDRHTDTQRYLGQLRNALDERTKRLAETDELVRLTKEELSCCKDSWEQDSRTATATIELLESDREIYKDGAETLAETIDHQDREIERLRSHIEQLEAASLGKEGEHLQLVEQNNALQKDLAEVRELLHAVEAPVEPLGRAAARKRRKL